jgi:hypothetical protein
MASTCVTTASGVGRLSLCGRDDRSCRPATPSALKRFHHLRAVRGQTPVARAAASGVCPLSIWRSTVRRQTGILVDVHPVLRVFLKLRNLSIPDQDRMDNLMKTHI